MKINKKETSKSKKKNILLIGAIILVVCAIAASLAYAYAQSNNNSDKDLPADSSQTNENGNQVTPNEENSNSGTLPSKATDPSSPKPESLEVSITAANQTGSVLQIRALINSVIQGECTLSLSRADNTTVTQSAPTQSLASTSTCSGFDVDTTNLKAGEWEATIKVATDTLSGTATQKVTIK